MEKVNLQNETNKIIKDNERDILNLVFQNQLFEKGEDAKGNKLPMPYSPFTIKNNKIPENLPYDRITLYQRGDFYNGGVLIQEGNNFRITSTDEKKDTLLSNWGDILNLQKENKNLLTRDYVLPGLKKYIRNALRL